MRKYYVIEISEGDKKIAGKGIYEYATENEAVASFHKKLGVAMSSDLYTSDLVMVVDDNGAVLRVEKYVSSTPAQEVVDVEEEMPTPMDSDDNE